MLCNPLYKLICIYVGLELSSTHWLPLIQAAIPGKNDKKLPGHIAQSVTGLATDACLTADPGASSSIPALSHTFFEIDHEIISMLILLSSAETFKKSSLSVTSESMCTKYW